MNDKMKKIEKDHTASEAEFKSFSLKIELDFKKMNTSTDRCFYLLDKVERAH